MWVCSEGGSCMRVPRVPCWAAAPAVSAGLLCLQLPPAAPGWPVRTQGCPTQPVSCPLLLAQQPCLCCHLPCPSSKEIVVFKDGYRSRSYCLSECTQASSVGGTAGAAVRMLSLGRLLLHASSRQAARSLRFSSAADYHTPCRHPSACPAGLRPQHQPAAGQGGRASKVTAAAPPPG